MTKIFTTLNDARGFDQGDDVAVWYATAFRPKTFEPHHTHRLLGFFSLKNFEAETQELICERIYHALQGEVWSPLGEARTMIEAKGLEHTSMSVGDIVRFRDGSTYLCSSVGWKRI